jgi:hypothetical protein
MGIVLPLWHPLWQHKTDNLGMAGVRSGGQGGRAIKREALGPGGLAAQHGHALQIAQGSPVLPVALRVCGGGGSLQRGQGPWGGVGGAEEDNGEGGIQRYPHQPGGGGGGCTTRTGRWTRGGQGAKGRGKENLKRCQK